MSLGTVLVTGGAGFIGCALADQLIAHADRWVVMDSLHPQVHAQQQRPAALAASAELIVGDVAEAADWDRVLAAVTPDVVFHFAAETGTAQSLDEATRHARVNVVGTSQLTDALGRHAVTPRHVLLSSSRAVYGEGRWQRADGSEFSPGQRSHEQLASGHWDFPAATALPSTAASTTPAPTSVYGATKLAQEHMLGAWSGSRGVPVTTLRLQNVYGPGQSLTNSYTGIVSLFSQLARRGETIPLYEDGQVVRDFVYIDDVAAAFAAAALEGPSGDRPVLDIGTGVGSTLQQLAEVIAEYHGAPAPTVNGRFRDGDVRKASCRIDAALEHLPWSPQWDMRRGVAALQEWIELQLG